MAETKTTLLIVDDSPFSREQISHVAKEAGFHIAGFCKNGLEALEFLDSKKVQLVSIDIIMPVMDGLELYKHIQKKHPQQACIFITALANDRAFIQAVQDRIPTWMLVGKPTLSSSLLHAAKEALGNSKSLAAENPKENNLPLNSAA